MVWKRFFKSTPAATHYYTVCGSTIKGRDNPLPTWLPSLYADALPASDEVDALALPLDPILSDLVRDLRQPTAKLPKLLRHNLRTILEVPAVFHLARLLQKKNKRLLHNTVAVLALYQVCSFRATGRQALKYRGHMMATLVGIALRYAGFQTLPAAHRAHLCSERGFDLEDPRQLEIRKGFLKSYQAALNDLSQRTQEFCAGHIASPACDSEALNLLKDVAVCSIRLMGRAKADLDDDVLQSLHPHTTYVAMLHSFASAWLSGKPIVQILAEEWGRARVFQRRKILELANVHNPDALADLFRLAQSVVLDNYRGRTCDAVYRNPTRTLAKEIPLLAEMKPDRQHSVRRFETRERIEKGNAAMVGIDPERLRIQRRWASFSVEDGFEARPRSENDPISVERQVARDPGTHQLTPIE